MGFVVQCIIGTLAAVGLICSLKLVYDIIIYKINCPVGQAVLYLYVSLEDATTEHLLRTAASVRHSHLPRLTIILIDDQGAVFTFAPDDPIPGKYNLIMQKGIR